MVHRFRVGVSLAYLPTLLLLQGAVAPLTGERRRQSDADFGDPVVWTGWCYSYTITGDGCNVFSGGFFHGGDFGLSREENSGLRLA